MNKGQRIGLAVIVAAILYGANQTTMHGLILLFVIFIFILKGHDKSY